MAEVSVTLLDVTDATARFEVTVGERSQIITEPVLGFDARDIEELRRMLLSDVVLLSELP